ncbi:alpha/beta hydrolase family protein [Paenibacillus spongiae]|uniref:Acetylxylan esterase n=1 Tax=Paenibacillus spongiae TaxID=2909671 RepID=A0ABY5S161_9BACL|nr:acetylxylan esterase [Paenibacillus spongiae]UVI27596.1 acetylxylan esterase [Paenibacillus spongiae]
MPSLSELETYICTLYDTRDQFKRHIFDRADEAFARGDDERDRIRTIDQLAARKAEMRRLFLESAGGLPASSASLNARTIDIVQGDGFQIEKITFESRPDHIVTANLYMPDGINLPAPAVLFLCGHDRDAKHSERYHLVCSRLALAGLIVLAIDPIGQGERLSYIPEDGRFEDAIWGTQEHQRAGAQCLPIGQGLARYFVHDAMRAVDYLSERPEVDSSRIGVTGNSGGGTQASMLMICDDRIAAAAPGTFIMNRQTYMHAGGVQDAEQIWRGLTGHGFDHEDILLAFAPKPLAVLAVTYDFFPIEATRRTVGRCSRFWEMHRKSDQLLLIEDESEHRFTDKLAEAAAAFFSEHLLNRKLERDDPDPRPIPRHLLQSTPSGQVLIDMKEARTVWNENVDFALQLEQLRSERESGTAKHDGIRWLKERVFASRQRCDLNPRRVPLGNTEDGLAAEYVMWWSQEGVMNSGMIFRGGNASGAKNSPLTVAVWEGGTAALIQRRDWLQSCCSNGRSVLVLNASGVGPHSPYPIYDSPPLAFYGVMHKLSDELLWLGDSLTAMRTFDVIRCLDLIEHLKEYRDGAIDFYTAGRTNLYVMLAAAIDDRIGRIAETNGLRSVTEWVCAYSYEEEDAMSYILPGMLHYFDLADLDRWRHERSAALRNNIDGK